MSAEVQKIDPNYIKPNIEQMVKEFGEGKEIGEDAKVEEIEDNFSWKRGFVNCWTGWPNDGKSTFFSFMATVMSVHQKYKWCFWSPEMMNSYRVKGTKEIKVTASDVYDELVFMRTGKCPYKHWKERYNVNQMPLDEYMAALEWVEEHFFVVYPRDRMFRSLIDNFKYMYEYYGVDGFLADPFKSFKHSEDGRTDLYLDDLFFEFKDLATYTHTSFNFVAHPKSQAEPKNKDGSYKVCTQHMLAGGASWNNNMDGIYSVYRPNRHKSPTDPFVSFYNLKQRKQQLVGRCGVYDEIEFDFLQNRYFFKGVCPIDGSVLPEKQIEKPGGVDYRKASDKKKSLGQIEFKSTLIDYGEQVKPNDNDDVPF